MQNETRRWSTVGASTNIIEASWLALADAVEYGLTVAPTPALPRGTEEGATFPPRSGGGTEGGRER